MGVTVVIPARNEALWLPRCLESLSRQTLPPDEIIVANNGSMDGTSEIALTFGCKVVTEPIAGVGRARALGCRLASSELVAMTDADTVVPPNWLARIAAEFEHSPRCVALTGPWRLSDGAAIARWGAVLHSMVLQRALSVVAPPLVNLVGCNAAFRREAYLRVGGFRSDLKIGEDLDLSLRLRAVGQVSYAADLVVWTSGRRFKKSALGGMGQYLPDASRQIARHLLGRRAALQPAAPDPFRWPDTASRQPAVAAPSEEPLPPGFAPSLDLAAVHNDGPGAPH